MNFEDQLRSALRAEAPPEGFAARTAARARAGGVRSIGSNRYLTLAIAAGVLAAAGIPAWMYQDHRRQMRGEAARQDLLTALIITKAQMRQINQKINRRTGTL